MFIVVLLNVVHYVVLSVFEKKSSKKQNRKQVSSSCPGVPNSCTTFPPHYKSLVEVRVCQGISGTGSLSHFTPRIQSQPNH